MKLALFFVFCLLMGDFFFGMAIAPLCEGHFHLAALFAFNAIWVYYLNNRIIQGARD